MKQDILIRSFEKPIMNYELVYPPPTAANYTLFIIHHP